jgi:hypothetical protein
MEIRRFVWKLGKPTGSPVQGGALYVSDDDFEIDSNIAFVSPRINHVISLAAEPVATLQTGRTYAAYKSTFWIAERIQYLNRVISDFHSSAMADRALEGPSQFAASIPAPRQPSPQPKSSMPSSSLRKQCNKVFEKLELMAVDTERLAQLPHDAIFVDDMLLRLKFWAADVQYDQGALERAEEVVEVSGPLRKLLQRLEEQIFQFDKVSKPASEEHTGKDGAQCISEVTAEVAEDMGKADDEDCWLTVSLTSTPTASRESAAEIDVPYDRLMAKHHLERAVNDLVCMSMSIKAAASIPDELRAEKNRTQDNQSPREIGRAMNWNKNYLMLKPSQWAAGEELLGAVLVDLHNPSSAYIAGDISLYDVDLAISKSFSIYAQIFRNWSASVSLEAKTPVPAISGAYDGRSVFSPFELGPTTITKRTIRNAVAYFKSGVRTNPEVVKLFSKIRVAFLVTSVLTTRMPGDQDATDTSSLSVAPGPSTRLAPAAEKKEHVFAFSCVKISKGIFRRKLVLKGGGPLL